MKRLSNRLSVSRTQRIIGKLLSLISIFIISGVIYYTLEVCWRGYSHWTMFVCAGVCGLIITFLNDYFYNFNTDFRIQCITGGIICSFVEYIIGILFNSDYSIWDYRGLWGTLKCFDSQINILFICLWMLICCFGIPFLDYIQWRFGLGERPWYRIGKKYYNPWEEKG